MLKRCWDYILGYSREQAFDEVSDRAELKWHDIRRPPWPKDKMEFNLPTKLSDYDVINIKGRLRGSEQFAINIVTGDQFPDYSNIACQILVNDNKIFIKTIKEGYESTSTELENMEATSIFPSSFDVSVRFLYGNVADISADEGSIPLYEFRMEHSVSDIKFINLSGEIERVTDLNFKFANKN